MKQRVLRPEMMDQPDLEGVRHVHALRGLERINRVSGSLGIVWRPIRDLATELAPQTVRVLDIACGAGDLPTRLWHRSRRAALSLAIDGCDITPVALAHARRRAQQTGAQVTFFPLDALHQPLPGDYDVLMCSLFLHHLQVDEAVNLLRRMTGAARRLVLINDLRRGVLGYWLAYLGTRLLTTSDVVHVDGPLSVQAAFTIDEVKALAQRAGLANATSHRRYP